jgi:3-hydroxyisobutyrate dehydrogenase-like beta-hydroxyacid dehydrogenase
MMQIGFLGLGKMGVPMVRRLLAAGHSVTVWNRSSERSAALAAEGAQVASTPAEAARGRDAVLTMLMDDAAHEGVVFGPDGILGGMETGGLHVSLSTISVSLSERLAFQHAQSGQLFVAAPVFGRPNVAADGRLWIAMAGAPNAIDRARPALEPLSRGITVVGSEPRQAHALKLGGNFMITSMIQTLSEAFVFARSQGIEPEVFLETVNSALFQSPLYAAYGNVILNPPATPGATITLGMKDTRLFLEAAGDTHLGLGEYLMEILREAQSAGLSEGDWAVGQYRTAERLAERKS